MGMDWGSGAFGALSGAATGAAVGSFVPVIGTKIGALAGGLIGGVSGLFGGGDDDEEEINIWEQLALQYFPEEYEVEPDYTETQDYLKGLGYDIMEGNLPEYYKPVGEYGGKEFEDMISSYRSDITDSVYTDIATRNVGRGGIGTTAITSAMNKVLPTLRYNDYSRAIQNRAPLLPYGTGLLENVRQSSFNLGQAKTDFGLNRFSTLLGGGLKQTALDVSQDNADTSMWGDIAGSATSILLHFT